MLAKVFRPTSRLLSSQQAKRLKELNEFLCIREAANPQASQKMLNDLQSAAKAHNLTPQQATEVLTFMNYDPEIYAKYFNNIDVEEGLEKIYKQYRESSVRGRGENYRDFYYQLATKYPKLVPLATPNSERSAAVDTLDQIFLQSGPKTDEVYNDNSIRRYIPQFENRIKAYVSKLKEGKNAQGTKVETPKGHPSLENNESIAEHTEKLLKGLVAKIHEEPALYFGHIRAFVAAHRQRLGVEKHQGQVLPQSHSGSLHSFIQKSEKTGEEGLVTLSELVEEQTDAIQTARYKIHKLPWSNDRKIIYEANIPKNNWKLWTGFGGLATLELVYALIQQELGFLGIASIGAVALYAAQKSVKLRALSSIDHLVQINVHNDGKYVDLFLENKNGTRKVEDVPITDFKLHTGNYKFGDNKQFREIANKIGIKTEDEVTLDSLRKHGLDTYGWVATFGDSLVLVPFNHIAHTQYIEQVFKGKQVDIAH